MRDYAKGQFRKAHYELMARTIAGVRAVSTVDHAHMLSALCNMLADDNPRFDAKRFLAACQGTTGKA